MANLLKRQRKGRLPIATPKWDLDLFLLIISISAGIITGIVRPNFLRHEDLEGLINSLRQFTSTFDAASIGLYAFLESLLRYGRFFLMMWACLLLPSYRRAVYLLLYMRAMTIGFSFAMMTITFGTEGILLALALYAIQNIIIMPVCAITSLYIARKKLSIAENNSNSTKLTIKLAAIGILSVVLVSFIEISLAPYLFELVK